VHSPPSRFFLFLSLLLMNNLPDFPPNFVAFLQKRLRTPLQKPLPGFHADNSALPVMAPFPVRTYEPPADTPYRNSAVMVLLAEHVEHAEHVENTENTKRAEDAESTNHAAPPLSILFTVRSSELRNHSGQISFAGGRSEDGETFVETALRETQEEIGIAPAAITVLGELTPLYVPVSTSYVHPVVGFYTGAQPIETAMNVSADEVSEVFFVTMETFLKSDAVAWMKRTMFGKEWDVPYWTVHPQVPLWGATAMVVREIVALYEESHREFND
jgi:8-oxo-dGTP pyrophosphatase MutT (NUDIX family)